LNQLIDPEFMTNNIFYTSIRYVIIDLIGDILYWPLWWYTRGTVKAGLFCLNGIKAQEERLGVMIWIKNISTPMFGQYDIEGRLISFFVRLIQIIARVILLFVWTIFMLLIFLAWLILPALISFQIFDHILWLFR